MFAPFFAPAASPLARTQHVRLPLRSDSSMAGRRKGARPAARACENDAPPIAPKRAPPAAAPPPAADALRPPLAPRAALDAAASSTADQPPPSPHAPATTTLTLTPLVDAALDAETRVRAALALDVGTLSSTAAARAAAARLQRALALACAARAADAAARDAAEHDAAAARRAADAATSRAALLEAALSDRRGAALWLLLVGAAPPSRRALARGVRSVASKITAVPAGGLLALAPRAARRVAARAAPLLGGPRPPRTKPKAPCHFDKAEWLTYLG